MYRSRKEVDENRRYSSDKGSSFERSMLTQSPLEERFLEDAQTVGLRLIPQFKVGNITADFKIEGHDIVIECDSKEFHSDDEATNADMERDNIYRELGYEVIRLPGRLIYIAGESFAEAIKYLINSDEAYSFDRLFNIADELYYKRTLNYLYE